MIYKVIERCRLPERFVWNRKWYECEYQWVKFLRKDGKTEIHGSDNGLMWNRLTGTEICSYDNSQLEEQIIQNETEPIDYARN